MGSVGERRRRAGLEFLLGVDSTRRRMEMRLVQWRARGWWLKKTLHGGELLFGGLVGGVGEACWFCSLEDEWLRAGSIGGSVWLQWRWEGDEGWRPVGFVVRGGGGGGCAWVVVGGGGKVMKVGGLLGSWWRKVWLGREREMGKKEERRRMESEVWLGFLDAVVMGSVGEVLVVGWFVGGFCMGTWKVLG